MPYLKKLRKSKDTLQKLAYDNIRQEIVNGRLNWGEQLAEESLANSLNISRTPVREAILLLEREGLVRKIPHKGFYVRDFSIEEIEQIYKIRSVLELLVIDILVEKEDQKWLRLLKKNVQKSKEILAQGKTDSLLYLISEFHEILYEATGWRRLCDLLSALGGEVMLNRCLAVKTEGVYADFVGAHEQLMNALAQRDKSAAQKTLQLHLGIAKQRTLQTVKEMDD